MEVGLQNRIDRRQQRLDHVVQQMGKADRRENREYGSLVCLSLRFDFNPAGAHQFRLSNPELFGD